MNTYIQIAISIATILGSGVVSAIVAHKFTVSRAEREFRRKKLEELFLAADRYCRHLMTWNMVWTPVMKGDLDYNQGLDVQLQNKDKLTQDYEVIDMLVALYFQELRTDLDKILSRRDKTNEIHSAFRKTYEQQGETEQYIKPFNAQLLQLTSDEKSFKAKVVELANKLSADK
jgi:hypothetical protein